MNNFIYVRRIYIFLYFVSFFYDINLINYLYSKLFIQDFHFTWKPGKTWNLRNFEKTWNFVQKSLKNLENPGIFNNFCMLSSKISI